MNPPAPPRGEPDEEVRARKRALRAQVLAARAALSPGTRAAQSAAACARVLAMPAWADARTVAAYLSIGEEFDTTALVRAILGSGRRLALPRIVDPQSSTTRHLVLHEVRDPAADTRPGPWGIREPDPDRCPQVSANAIGLMLVPGLAFDARGGRLGYGAGYYDRLIAQTTADCVKLAAVFALQFVDEVPMQAHDQRVDWVVTAQAAHRAGSA